MIGSIEHLYRKFGRHARFYVIYTQEAHATDAWQTYIRQGATPRDRRLAACSLKRETSLTVPVLLDSPEDHVARSYSATVARVYVIDRTGRIAFRTGEPAAKAEMAAVAAAIERLL